MPLLTSNVMGADLSADLPTNLSANASSFALVIRGRPYLSFGVVQWTATELTAEPLHDVV
jgi:hypothetical protein